MMGHHSVHTAFNLLELERHISKMAMTQKKISFVKFGEEKSKIHFPLKYSARSQTWFFKHVPDCCYDKFSSYSMLSPGGLAYVLKSALVVM